jgi:hypothetical protein
MSGQSRRSDNRTDRGRGRLIAVALSLTAHVAILCALLWARGESPKVSPPAAMSVAMVDLQPFAPQAAPTTPKQARARSAPPRTIRLPFLTVDPLPAAPSPAADSGDGLSESQLAGAATAGGGGAPGECDMAARVQNALRKDPMVQAAVAGSAGKATLVWDGDWVRSHGEDGKGLAAVREAIIWEVAFAPEACRAQPVRGLVLLSMNAAAGATRLAVGGGDWRWSDLLRR